MADKETVIKGLESLKQDYLLCKCDTNSNVIDEAIAMLKKQEAVAPYQHDAVWLCGNCEKEVVGWDDDFDGKEYRYPFCRQCGKAVKCDGNHKAM